MTSQHEDTAVDDLDFSKMSDSDVKDVADNDSRTTAQEKAQAELNRREKDSDTSVSDGPARLLPDDPKERAEALGLNTEGMNFDPDYGQLQLQDYMDAVDETGYHPPTGGPPDDSLTLEKVVEREQEIKKANREAMEAQVAGKDG